MNPNYLPAHCLIFSCAALVSLREMFFSLLRRRRGPHECHFMRLGPVGGGLGLPRLPAQSQPRDVPAATHREETDLHLSLRRLTQGY